MQKNTFRKSLVVGIIMFLVGSSVITSIGNSILVNHDLQENKTTFKDTRSGGYIQGLIDNASDGDTIYIPSGIYYEHIIINKSISLVGEDKDTTIIDGGGGGNVVSIVSANWVNISGFTIQHSGYNGPFYAIICSYYNNITSNTIKNTEFGITLCGGGNTIIDNTIINNIVGIVIREYSDYNNIINNIIINNEAGIYSIGDNNIIIGNTISNNGRMGIDLWWSSGNNISGNIINDNKDYGINIGNEAYYNIIDNNMIFNSKYGLYLGGAEIGSPRYNVIVNNSFFNTGVFTERTAGIYNSFFNNTVNNKPLVFLVGASDMVIDDAGQIILYYCENITIQNVELCNSTIGIIIETSDNCRILNNSIRLNRLGGLEIRGSKANNTITGNYILNSEGNGISILYSNNTIITNNIISDNNGDGICLYSSSSNTITGNNISSNNGYGIYINWYNNDNIIYHNNLINNDHNANDPQSNMWYNAELQEGNYWSDYTGIDFNSDGIGDIPYDIPGGSNQDLYPFMEPDGWLKEPEFCKAFIFGKITNLIATGKYITFEALKTLVITFKPFSFHKYVSGEKLILSKDYLGLIGVRYIFALCEIVIKI